MRQLAVTKKRKKKKKERRRIRRKRKERKKGAWKQVPESTPITSHTIINHSATNACPQPFESLT